MTYKLKEWETWESEVEKHPPRFCPNCAEPLSIIQEYWSDSNRKSSPDNPFKGIGYDCYCKLCRWSGNIEPDADSDIVNEHFRKGE